MGQSKDRSGTGCGTLAGWGALLSGIAAIITIYVSQANKESSNPASLSPSSSSQISPSAEQAAQLLSRAQRLKGDIVNIENALGKLEATELSINQSMMQLSQDNPARAKGEELINTRILPEKRKLEDLLRVAQREQQEVNDVLRQMGVNPP